MGQLFSEQADRTEQAESFRWGTDDAIGQLPPDDGTDWEAEARRLEEEQWRRQEEERQRIEEQARRDQEDYNRILEERAAAVQANQLAATAPPGTSTYNDPTAGGTQSQPLSFADTANGLIDQTFGQQGPAAPPMPEDASDSERFVQTLSAPSEPRPAPLQNDVPFDPGTNQTGEPAATPAQYMSDTSPEPEQPKPPTFLEQANNLISGAFGQQAPTAGFPEPIPDQRTPVEQLQDAIPQIGANMAGNRQAVEEANAGREGGPDFQQGLRTYLDTYGFGSVARESEERSALERELSDYAGKPLVRPGSPEEQAWQAENPEKAARLDELRANLDALAAGASGTMGGGGMARDAVEAIKALRSAGLADAALQAERELASKTSMTLAQIQEQTGAAIRRATGQPETPAPEPTVPEAAVTPETPTAGPQPGDSIRLPDGTRARVEEPPLYHGTTRQFDQFDPNAPANYNPHEGGTFFTEDPAIADRFALEGSGSARYLDSTDSGLTLEQAQARAAEHLNNGGALATSGERGGIELIDNPGAITQEMFDNGVWFYPAGESPRVVKANVSGKTLDLTDATRWPMDLVDRLRASKDAADQRLYQFWEDASRQARLENANPRAGRLDPIVYHDIPRSPALREYAAEQGVGKIRTVDSATSGGESIFVPDAKRIGPVAPHLEEAPPAGVPPAAPPPGGTPPPPGGGRQPALPASSAQLAAQRAIPSSGAQLAAQRARAAGAPPPPPGGRPTYTTVQPPGPPARGGGTPPGGGPPAAGGVPPAGGGTGGGGAPPVGSLYANPPSSPRSIPSLRSIADWLTRVNTDRRVDLNNLQKAVSREIGRALNPDELVSELSRRNVNHAANIRLQEGLRPAFQSMGEDLPLLSEALTYLDNIAVSRALGNPNRTFSWGLTAAESQQRLTQLINQMGGVNDPRVQTMNKAIQDVRAFTDSYRKRMLDSGVWSQDLYNDLTTRYPTYIPTRILDYLKNDAAVASGKKLGLSDRGLRQHTIAGTALEREDPLASITRLAYDSERRINQNETFNAFVKLRDASPAMQQQIRQVPASYTARQGETLVHGFVDGEKRIYAMSDPIARAVQMDDGVQMPGFVRGVTSAFRALITHSPVFIAGQIPLDAFSYGVREAGRSKYGPLAIPQIGIDLVRAYHEAFKGLLSGEFKGDAAAYLREGGGMAGWHGRSREAAAERVSELAHQNMFEIRNKGDIGRLLKWIATMQPVSAIGERVELAPRIASYRRAGRRMTDQTTNAMLTPPGGGAPIPIPQQGQRPLSAVERVMAGRDVTLDFERGGLLSRYLNQAIPFYNVGWQSSAAIARAARENPVGFSTSALSIVGGLALGAEAWNRSDPQLAKDYEDVPDYIKDRGIVIMLPGQAPVDKDGNRRPNYLTIPMRELAPIAILTREAALKSIGKDTRGWSEILGSTVAAASPIQATGPEDLFSSFNPIGLNTALQVRSDRDFFRGQRINTKFRNEEASAASKALSAAARNQGIELSPSQIEFILRDLGGGASRAGLAASDMAAGKVRDDSRVQNTPLVGDLIRRYVGDQTGGVMNREREQTISPATRAKLRAAGVEYAPGPVDFELDSVPLRRAEVGSLQTKTNQYVEAEIARSMAHPKWKTWSPADRDAEIKAAVHAAREHAKDDLVKEIGAGEFRRRARESAQAAGR